MKKLLFITLLLYTSILFSQKNVERILTKNKGDDRYANYSPDGKSIVFESNRDGNWEIYLMDANGDNQIRLTDNAYNDRRPSWHPNGKKIVFESDRQGEYALYELKISNKKVREINIPGLEGVPIFAQYSPNGEQIAFSLRKSDERSSIEIVSSNGKGLRTLFYDDARSTYPNWSSNGKSILFFSRHETDNKDDEIYVIGPTVPHLKRLTHYPKHNFCPSWSKDGKKIAYVTSFDDIRPEIYMMDSSGSHQIRLTYNEDGDTLPRWSPDSKKILFTGYRNGNWEICELLL